MCLDNVYIVREPVGSARLTFHDDLYYDLCVFDDRSLFGVRDDEESRNGREVKIDILEGYVRTPESFGEVQMFSGVPRGYRNPPGKCWANMGLREREGSPRGWATRPPPRESE